MKTILILSLLMISLAFSGFTHVTSKQADSRLWMLDTLGKNLLIKDSLGATLDTLDSTYFAGTTKGALLNTRIDTMENGIAITDGDSLLDFNAKTLRLDTTGIIPAWRTGQMWHDTLSKSLMYDIGIPDVRLNVGEEMYYTGINQTGDTLHNGTVVYANGRDTILEMLTIDKADNRSTITSLHTLGFVTHDCVDQQRCKVTYFGQVHDVPVVGSFPEGTIWLDTTGGYVDIAPRHPLERISLGTIVKNGAMGTIQANIQRIDRREASSTESFNSAGIGAGVFFIGGYYAAPTTSSNLVTCNDSVSYGSAGNAYHAHSFIVGGATASVTGGTVGLYVTGNAYNETTRDTATINDTLTTDITTYALNEYDETPTKYNGTVKYKLFTSSGAPSACSYRFNYGYSKYEDFSNRNFTLSNVDCNFRAGANDPNFKIEVLHHKPAGWTYAATGFVSGDGIIASSEEMAPNDNLVNTLRWVYEAVNIHLYIDGAGEEGMLTRVTTGLNNSVTSGRCRYSVDIEDIQ